MVEIPEYLRNSKVNMNDFIEIDITYEKVIDFASFNLIFIF